MSSEVILPRVDRRYGLLMVVIAFGIFGYCMIFSDRWSAPINIFQKSIKTVVKRDERMNASVCKLADAGPWSHEINGWLVPVNGHVESCNITTTRYTELRDGQLKVVVSLQEDELCKYRCILTNGLEGYKTTNWTVIEANETVSVECDFVETRCFNASEGVIFAYVHMQVEVEKNETFARENGTNPSVLVFVVDSVSRGNAQRSLSRTLEVLHKYYKSTTFYYHNKAGANSRPNAFSMFAGTRIEPIRFGIHRTINSTMEEEIKDSCQKIVPDDLLVLNDFEKLNYSYTIADEWLTAFGYPGCTGFSHYPNHYLRSLTRLIEDQSALFKSDYVDGKCVTRTHIELEFGSKFLDSYRGISKFALIWNCEMSHDDLHKPAKADQFFAEFFERHIENLENSFVFFMGDHGFRFGGFRETDVGRIEDNNPFLEVAVPKWLRDNKELRNNIMDNSRIHTSQFDLHATLVDIAKVARKDGFTSFGDHDFREELGEMRGRRAKSLFRPILTNRTCEEMDIPDDYCLCQEKWIKSDEIDDSILEMGNFLTEAVNKILVESKLDGICEKIQLDKVIKAERHETEPVVRMRISTQPTGSYEAQVRTDDNKLHLVSALDRVDRYGPTSECASESEQRKYCYCKPTTSTTSVPSSTHQYTSPSAISTQTPVTANLEGGSSTSSAISTQTPVTAKSGEGSSTPSAISTQTPVTAKSGV